MLLYVLCLHPLFRILEENLPGIQVGTRARSTVIVAYADDVTVFVTDPTDFTIISNAIQKYELATSELVIGKTIHRSKKGVCGKNQEGKKRILQYDTIH